MFQVVDQCPTLKKDIQILEQKQISLQKKEAQIYKEFEIYRAKKEQDLKIKLKEIYFTKKDYYQNEFLKLKNKFNLDIDKNSYFKLQDLS